MATETAVERAVERAERAENKWQQEAEKRRELEMELHKQLQIPKAVDMFSIWMHKIVFLLPSLRVCILFLSLTIQNPSDTRCGH